MIGSIVCWLCATPALAQNAPADNSTVSDVPSQTSDDIPQAQPNNANDDVLTLQRALALAVQRAPTLKQARSETEAALLKRFAIRMEHAPEISITVAAGPGPRGRTGTRADGSSVEDLHYLGGIAFGGKASVVVPVSTFGKIKIATELADLGIDAAKLKEEVKRADTRFEAFRAYTGLQWYRKLKPVIQDVYQKMDDAYDKLQDRIDEGDYSVRNDMRQLTIHRADVVRMDGELTQVGFMAQQAMRLVLGISPDTKLMPFDDTPPRKDDLPSVDSLLAYAVEHRPDYQRLSIALKAADKSVQLQKKMMTPNAFFRASGSFVYTPTLHHLVKGEKRPARPGISETPDRFNDLSGALLVGLQWKIQPGKQRAAVRMAKQRAETVHLKVQSAKMGLKLQIHEAWVKVQQQLLLVQAEDEARHAANAWMKQRAFQFDQGFAQFDDLVDPLKAYYKTIGKYYEALLRYRLLVANLNVTIGHEDLTTLPSP